jgi:hypothetical protein
MRIVKAKRLLLVGLAVAATAIASGPGQASAATLTVCPSGCAFTQIAPALAGATDGDTISVGPGTYDGGFTIDNSIKLTGAGAAKTIISGGGPVVTIGTFGAASEPTVSISGVTITGGVTRSSPESTAFFGKDGVVAAGGGIEIPPNGGFSGGATVTISNSVISGNEVAPSDSISFGRLSFAFAFGGGIDDRGTLTLSNTTVSDNRIGSASGLSTPAAFAEGGGVYSPQGAGALTISNSVISGNRTAVSAPNAIVADAGGISFDGSGFTTSNSSVTGNSATVTGSLPFGGVPSGGIHVNGDALAATIGNTTISGNTATMTSAVGDANASSGGLHLDVVPSNISLSNDVITGNHVVATTLSGSTGNADGSSGAGEISGTLSKVRLTGNTVDVASVAGDAFAGGGASIFDGGMISNGVVSDNHIQVSSPFGTVTVRGGGINVAGGATTLRNTPVSGNTVDASGAGGSTLGGGIYDVAFPDGQNGPPGGPLAVLNSSVTGNVLTASAGILRQGGGLFLQNEPLTLTNSVITQNVPDQCVGC